MATEPSELGQAIDLLRDAVRALDDLMEDAHDDQWAKSRLTAGTDAGHSDPTGDTATDPRRLALREEYRRAEGAVTLATQHVTAATTRLTEAHNRWSGEREP